MPDIKKGFRVLFEGENVELHKKIKIMAAVRDESMNDFIIAAIKDRIKKIEARQK